MEERALIDKTRERLGGGSDSAVCKAIEAVLQTVGETIGRSDTAAVATALPNRFADALAEANAPAPLDFAEFCSRVARREGVALSFGVEHSQSVIRALCELIGEQERTHLCGKLWPELLRRSLVETSPSSGIRPPRIGSTLADGQPGSSKPLSAAPPPSRAHEHSVAAANPHGARKLSSGASRTDKSLSTGRTGSGHPLSEQRRT